MAYADRHLLITFKDQPFRYYPGRATAPFARECRRVFGKGPAALWASVFSTGLIEVDHAASLLWLARAQMAEQLGVPDLAMTLDEIDGLLTADDASNSMTIELKDFAPDDAEKAPIETVTESTVGEDGETVVAPDPEV